MVFSSALLAERARPALLLVKVEQSAALYLYALQSRQCRPPSGVLQHLLLRLNPEWDDQTAAGLIEQGRGTAIEPGAVCCSVSGWKLVCWYWRAAVFLVVIGGVVVWSGIKIKINGHWIRGYLPMQTSEPFKSSVSRSAKRPSFDWRRSQESAMNKKEDTDDLMIGLIGLLISTNQTEFT